MIFFVIFLFMWLPLYDHVAQAATRVKEGRDGWLIYVDPDDVGNLYDFRHQGVFSVNDLAKNAQAIQRFQDKLQQQGIQFAFGIAPNTPTIYPQSIPRHIKPVNSTSRMDQWMDYLQKNTSVHVINLKAALQKHTKMDRLYHKTDTHWNDLGGWVGYTEIMHAFQILLPTYQSVLAPRSLAEFDVYHESRPGGDLAKMLGLQDLLVEKAIALEPQQAPQAQVIWSHDKDFITERSDLCPGPRILIYRDSFFMAIQPHLSEHFCHAKVLWTKEISWSDIVTEKPDIVFYMTVERYMSMALNEIFLASE